MKNRIELNWTIVSYSKFPYEKNENIRHKLRDVSSREVGV